MQKSKSSAQVSLMCPCSWCRFRPVIRKVVRRERRPSRSLDDKGARGFAHRRCLEAPPPLPGVRASDQISHPINQRRDQRRHPRAHAGPDHQGARPGLSVDVERDEKVVAELSWNHQCGQDGETGAKVQHGIVKHHRNGLPLGHELRSARRGEARQEGALHRCSQPRASAKNRFLA